MNKRIPIVLSAIALVVVGCSGGGGGGPATPKPEASAAATAAASAATGASVAPTATTEVSGTVNLLVGIAEEPSIEKKLNDQVADFNASHPKIKVTRESLDNDQLRTVIQTRLSSGSVDLF
jgi:ABC-type glycerol-3-phosphate transport system substrate-binding protein